MIEYLALVITVHLGFKPAGLKTETGFMVEFFFYWNSRPAPPPLVRSMKISETVVQDKMVKHTPKPS